MLVNPITQAADKSKPFSLLGLSHIFCLKVAELQSILITLPSPNSFGGIKFAENRDPAQSNLSWCRLCRPYFWPRPHF